MENSAFLKNFYNQTMHLNSIIFIMVPIYTFYLFFMVLKADMVKLIISERQTRKQKEDHPLQTEGNEL